MPSENRFRPEQVREIAQNFPEVKRLMIEREQIKQDAKFTPTHTKLDPHPKPSKDIHHPKIHKEKDGAKSARENIFNERLKDNSKELETSFHDNFEKAGLEEMSDWAKEMNTEELTTFMEAGYDKVIEQRQEKDIEQELKMDEKESKEIFGDLEKEQEIISLEEKEIHHDKNIEQELKMDKEEAGKLFDREQQELSNFKDNSKDIDVGKRPSPSDDFE